MHIKVFGIEMKIFKRTIRKFRYITIKKDIFGHTIKRNIFEYKHKLIKH